MTTMNDPTERIANLDEEAQNLRQKQKERHEREKEELEGKIEDRIVDVRVDAGVDELAERWTEMVELRNEVLDVEKTVKQWVDRAINEMHSGGFQDEITVRDGHVYKYNRQKNARISVDRLLGFKRTVVDDLIDRKFSGSDARAFKLALDKIAETEMFGSKSWKTEREIDHEQYDTIRCYVKSSKYSRRGGTAWVGFYRESGVGVNDRFYPDKVDIDNTKATIEWQDEAEALVEDMTVKLTEYRDDLVEALNEAQQFAPVDPDVDVPEGGDV